MLSSIQARDLFARKRLSWEHDIYLVGDNEVKEILIRL